MNMVLTAERWQRLKVLFSAIADLPAEEQAVMVDRECGGDPELRSELLSLIERDRNASAFVDRPAAVHLAGAREPRLPESIGSYRILSEIGHGGMGTVYLAEREGEFRLQVAIKVIRGGMNLDHVVRRFVRERQILANLQHPNIARLLDGGTTADGLPYFVMEYVEGIPVDRYCREHALPLSERIRLFLLIASAVHSAHQSLVVHRDIKPSNILVTAQGEPKLLDFGIAKLLDESAVEEQTATEFRAMTPEYASPEQVLGLPLTTQSDVYSLGVVLCEVLTGKRPHQFSSRAPAELMRVLSETAPQKPSALVQKEEPGLARSLRGDLDTIVLTALRTEPRRRYASAEAFADDLRRYLNQLPVRARPDTLRYRTAKFVRRNALAAGATLLLALALVGGIAATSHQAIAARTAQQKAEARFAEVRRLANVMIFDLDPEISLLSGATPVRQKLVSTALEYLDALAAEADDPELQVEVATAYRKVAEVQGNPYSSNLGHPSDALRSYAKSRGILESLVAERPDNPRLQEALAQTLVGEGDVRFQQLELQTTLEVYTRAIELYERALSSNRTLSLEREHATVVTKLGDLLGNPGYSNLGRPDEAFAELNRALQIRTRLAAEHPNDDNIVRDLAQSLSKLGYLLNSRGNSDEGLAFTRRALNLMEGVVARNPDSAVEVQDLSHAYMTVGILLRENGKTDEAWKLTSRALELMQRLASRDPSSALWKRNQSVIHNHLSQTALDRGRASEALEHSRSSIAFARELWHVDEQNADAGMDLVISYRRSLDPLLLLGSFREAESQAREALDHLERFNTDGNQRATLERGMIQARLGRALASQGRRTEAIEQLNLAQSRFEELIRSGSGDALTRDELAITQYHRGRVAERTGSQEACRDIRAAAAIWQEMRGDGTLRWRSRDIASEAAIQAAGCERKGTG